MAKVESAIGDGVFWDRNLKRTSREERMRELLESQQNKHVVTDPLLIETVKRLSAFTGGFAAAPPTYYLLYRLIELAR